MVLNIYLVFFSFLLGICFGFIGMWLSNHYFKLFIIVFVIPVIWLAFEGIMSIFNPDTILRQTYSELQGWVDFVSGFVGVMLGFFLEERYEQKIKSEKKEV